MNMNLSVSEPNFVLQISQPPDIAEILFCIQNLHMNLSFQKKKTVQKSVSWFLRYYTNTKGPFFLGRPVHFENLVHFQCKAYIMCKVPFCACAACTFNPKNNFRAKSTFSAECPICYKMHIFFAIPTPSENCTFSTRCTFSAECIFSTNRSFIANCPLRAKSTLSAKFTQPKCSFAPSALCIWFFFCRMCTFNAKLTVGAKCSFCENGKFQSKACFEYFDSFFALIVQSSNFCTCNLHFNPK